jgi:hypothetical protein
MAIKLQKESYLDKIIETEKISVMEAEIINIIRSLSLKTVQDMMNFLAG